mmetsp:Transcript_27766/g.45137  ORF Transcript_27766/g.45137 Transcript_27766/m.45137 type:complete len:177 (-) Transcript_27766:554-1084(-)
MEEGEEEEEVVVVVAESVDVAEALGEEAEALAEADHVEDVHPPLAVPRAHPLGDMQSMTLSEDHLQGIMAERESQSLRTESVLDQDHPVRQRSGLVWRMNNADVGLVGVSVMSKAEQTIWICKWDGFADLGIVGWGWMICGSKIRGCRMNDLRAPRSEFVLLFPLLHIRIFLTCVD